MFVFISCSNYTIALLQLKFGPTVPRQLILTSNSILEHMLTLGGDSNIKKVGCSSSRLGL